MSEEITVLLLNVWRWRKPLHFVLTCSNAYGTCYTEKNNRHDVWTWTWTWVHSPWMRGSQFAVWEIRAVLAVDLRNKEMPSWRIPQTAHAHSGISYRAPLAQGLNVSSCHPNCFLSCWQVLGYRVSNFQVSISDLELSTVKEEKWSFWSCLILQEMAPSRIFF